MAKRLQFVDPSDSDSSAMFVAHNGGVIVSVSEEKAVDSYNRAFNCSFHLSKTEAEQVRNWLNALFPPA